MKNLIISLAFLTLIPATSLGCYSGQVKAPEDVTFSHLGGQPDHLYEAIFVGASGKTYVYKNIATLEFEVTQEISAGSVIGTSDPNNIQISTLLEVYDGELLISLEAICQGD